MKKFPIVIYPENEATSPSCKFYLLPPHTFDLFLGGDDNVYLETPHLETNLRTFSRINLIIFRDDSDIEDVVKEATGNRLNLTKTLFNRGIASPGWTKLASLKMGDNIGSYPNDIISLLDLFPECLLDAGEFIEDYHTVSVNDGYGLISSRLLVGFEDRNLSGVNFGTRLDHIVFCFFDYEIALTQKECAEKKKTIDDKIELLIDVMVDIHKNTPGIKITGGKLINSSYFEESGPQQYFNAFKSTVSTASKNWNEIDNELPFPLNETEGHRLGRVYELEFETQQARYLQNSKNIRYYLKTILLHYVGDVILHGSNHSSMQIRLTTDENSIIEPKDDNTIKVTLYVYVVSQ